MTAMEVDSVENGFDEISDLLKDDESTLPEDLDLDISVDFVYDNDSSEGHNKFNFHPSEQEQSELSSLSYNFDCHDIPGQCTGKVHSSSTQHGSHSDGLPNNNVADDQKLQHFPPQGDLYHQDAHNLCGDHVSKTALKMDAESVSHEVLKDACTVPEGVLSVQEYGLEGDTIPHAAIGEKTFLEALEQELNQAEFADSEEEKPGFPVDQIQKIHSPNLHLGDPKSKSGNANDSENSPDTCKEVDSVHVDQHEQSREISVPPETSIWTSHITDDHRFSASTGHGDVSSHPNTTDQIYAESEGCSQNGDIRCMNHSLHVSRQNSASSQGSGQRSQHGECSSGKSVATTGNHDRKRSRSLSPRQRNRSSNCKRDCYTNPGNHNMSVPQSHKNFSYTSRSHKRKKHDLAGSSDQRREVTCKDHLLDIDLQRPSCQHEPQERFLKSSSLKRAPPSSSRGNIFYGNNRGRNKSRSRFPPYGRNRKGYSGRHISPGRRDSSRDRSHSHHQIRYLSPASYRRTKIGKPGTCLFVAGFGFMTTERELERKFSRFGRVRNVRIIRDRRSGISRGYGFLSLERDGEADAAIRALHRTQWNGRVVLVEKSISN